MVAVIAQWIRLRLPFSSPGFESQAHHLTFYIYSQILYYIMLRKEWKRGRVWPILKNILQDIQTDK